MQRRPPAPVVLQMLRVAPQVATLPSSGPTALQVALQSGASLGVVRALLEACPFALCVARSFDAIDPLSYAKIHRRDEADLIELLSRPLSFWLSQGTFHPNNDRANSNYAAEVNSAPSLILASKEMSTSQVGSNTSDPSVDRQELDNVKLLCAQVLKGHKKLARQLELFQSQLHSKTEYSSEKSSAAARQVLATLKEEQQKQFRIQLIAMEMKERAFGARAKQMEEHCLRSFNEQLVQWKKSQDVSHPREDNVSEMQRNVQFRRDFTRRMEPSRLEVEENQYGQEVVLVEHKHVPVVFATNSGDVGECAPLNMTSVSSIDEDSDDSKTVEPSSSPPRPSRRIWRYPIDRESSVRRSCFSL